MGLGIIGLVFLYVVADFLGSSAAGIATLRKHIWRGDLGLFSTLAQCTGAFQAHYNSPKFFAELGSDLGVHSRMVVASFGLAFLIYACFAASGLAIFGDAVLGNVLKNYPAEGHLAIFLAWLGLAFAVIFTYPLAFSSTRDSLLGLVPSLVRAQKSSHVGRRTCSDNHCDGGVDFVCCLCC